MLLHFVLLILGFGLLISGANWLVNGSSMMAEKFGVSDLTIGLTIVAFGTSAPELTVSIMASLGNHRDIILGNVIGSNNFNLFVILGLSGLITPLAVQSSTVWKEIPFSFLAVVILFFLSNDFFFFLPGDRTLTFIDGLILIGLFGLFLLYVKNQLKKEKSEKKIVSKKLSAFKIWGLIIFGLGSLVVGGSLVVNNAVKLALLFSVSEKIIGLTVVAAGTSLPELATSVVAAIKKNSDIAVGNIIGSNIFNILLILGTSLLIGPVNFNEAFNIDMYVLGVGTILLFVAMFSGIKRKLDRWEAAAMLVGYILYLSYLVRL